MTIASSDPLDQVLQALANPHRRAIVYLLGLQPFAVHQLAQQRGLSLPAIHKHLQILDLAGFLVRRKQGRTNYLTLDPRPLQLLQTWVGQFHPYWAAPAASYDNYAQHLAASEAATPARPPTPNKPDKENQP